MDPLSITASVVGLASICVQTAKALRDIKDKFQGASLTVSAICTETTIISASLSRIQSSLLGSPDEISDKLRERPDLEATLDNALTGCYLVFDVLQAEIQKFTESKHSEFLNPGLRAKLRYVWNETAMQDILTQMRGLQTALALLLQLLGSETMAQLKQIMNNNTTVLEKLVQQNSHCRVTRPLRTPQSIFDLSFTTQTIPYDNEESMISSTLFTFDDEVVNSQAYRRALTKASTHSKKTDNSPNADNGRGVDPAVKVLSAAAEQSKDSGRAQSFLFGHYSDSADPTLLSQSSLTAPISHSTVALPEKAQSLPPLSELVLSPTPRDELMTFLSEDPGARREGWASYWAIPATAPEAASTLDVMRQQLFHEIIITEHLYLRQLQSFRYLYKQRMMLDFSPRMFGGPEPNEVILTIANFTSFEDIFHAHRALLYDPLKSRQSTEGPWLSTFWDILRNWMDQSVNVYLKYISLFPTVHYVLRQEERRNPTFSRFLRESSEHKLSYGYSWESCLKIPIARLRKYPLLLQLILKASDKLNPSHHYDDLVGLIKDLKSFLVSCNAALAQSLQKVEVDDLRSRMPGSGQRLLPENSEVHFRQWMLLDRGRFRDKLEVIVLVIRKPARVVVLREASKAPVIGEEEYEVLFEVLPRTP
ncbi:MAG: hypothetical protein Q9172_006794 [Xanthocarpia lactea]